MGVVLIGTDVQMSSDKTNEFCPKFAGILQAQELWVCRCIRFFSTRGSAKLAAAVLRGLMRSRPWAASAIPSALGLRDFTQPSLPYQGRLGTRMTRVLWSVFWPVWKPLKRSFWSSFWPWDRQRCLVGFPLQTTHPRPERCRSRLTAAMISLRGSRSKVRPNL